MNLPLTAAPAHHIPPNVAGVLGWVVVVAIVAGAMLALGRILGGGK